MFTKCPICRWAEGKSSCLGFPWALFTYMGEWGITLRASKILRGKYLRVGMRRGCIHEGMHRACLPPPQTPPLSGPRGQHIYRSQFPFFYVYVGYSIEISMIYIYWEGEVIKYLDSQSHWPMTKKITLKIKKKSLFFNFKHNIFFWIIYLI